MKKIKPGLLLMVALLISLYSVDHAFANKASVSIEAPQSASRGSEVTIKITVMHSANNIFHHVSWAYIMINGKEVARWDYSWKNLPDTIPFTREIRYVIEGPANIRAEASCNIHGSKGPDLANISVK